MADIKQSSNTQSLESSSESDLTNVKTTSAVDEGGAAEAIANSSLSYNQLVIRRFRRNRYGMAGFIICVFIIFVAIFHGFLAPYDETTINRQALYSPPQLIRIVSPEGNLSRPHVLGFTEEMDMNTFEITFIPDAEQRADIAFFVKGDEVIFSEVSPRPHDTGMVTLISQIPLVYFPSF